MRGIRIFMVAAICGFSIWWLASGQNTEFFVSDDAKDTEHKREFVNYDIPLSGLFDSLNIERRKVAIHVDKSDYLMELRYDDEVIKSYPVVFGENPVDDKRMEGDRCTPEGTFHIVDKYPHKKWNKFIWIDYPTPESWRKFKKAKKVGEIPKDATIGGEVGIHSPSEGYDYLIDDKVNWTWGCIAMKRNDLNEIYSFITKANDIVITR